MDVYSLVTYVPQTQRDVVWVVKKKSSKDKQSSITYFQSVGPSSL